jgi:hypothetical protein
MDMLDVTNQALDRIYGAFDRSSSSADTAHKSYMTSQGQKEEKDAPHASLGSAEAGIPSPVTCRPRYYDAASTILEDELRLFTHANANELGAVIEQWIERKRGNLGPL